MSLDSERPVTRKRLVGRVVSDKMDKTIVVLVTRKVRHKKYPKFVNLRQRCFAHDEQNECRIGDEVEITETRPLSRKKRWRLTSIRSRNESGLS